ncbi:MAG: hypothetical protein PHE68_02915 [Candidatus Peribacteraceae bacterium]|nr:hypothetical protein [Candidatus Peribacteraceae bacterium]MDD5074816.1 hypothetical protein [Candidatus Peribacteraceae bacterium]
MDQKHQIPAIPATGKDLYNLLMLSIEPELTTDQFSLLKTRYQNETQEQAKARAEKYSKAFIEYEKAYISFVEKMNRDLAGYRKEQFQSVENEEREQRMKLITNMELPFVS